MLIKDRKYRTCKSCEAKHLVSQEVYGCDTCKKVLDMNQPEVEYLRASVHRHDQQAGDSREVICCSWVCMLKALRKVKSDYFVSLPFLHFDKASKGMRARDFFALLK